MHYRAAGPPGRRPFCSININELDLPIPYEQADKLLDDLGFKYHEIDLLTIARSLVGKAQYERGADWRLVPHTVDCSSFIKYLYALRGIWLPRYAIQQSELGRPVKPQEPLQLGDLLFSPGKFPLSRPHKDAPQIGHVGFATGQGTVIHASCWKGQVSEVDEKKFMTMRHRVCSIKRLIEDPEHTLTYSWPEQLRVETSDDVRWLILTQLRR